MKIQKNTELFREKLINNLLLTLSILAIPIGFLSVYRVHLFGWKPLFTFQLFVAASLIIIYLFRKSLSFKIRALSLIFLIFLLGVFALLTWGLMGMGIFFLLLDIILTSFLFEYKYCYYLLTLETIVFIIIGIIVQLKWLPFNFNFYTFAYSGFNWINTITVFVGFSAVLIAVAKAVYKNIGETNRDLAISEERFNLALESVNEALYDTSVVTGESYVSPSYCTMLGYDVNEFNSNYYDWKKLLHPLDIEKTEEELKKHLRGETATFSVEYRMKTKKGEWRWILDRGQVVERDTDNRPLRMVGTHTDITEQKEALHQLQLTNKLLEHAQKIAKTGHYRYDYLANELTWSSELYMIYMRYPQLGPPSAEEHEKLMAEGDWNRIKELKMKGLETGEQMMTEYSIIWPEGSKRNLFLVMDWEKDEHGNIVSEVSTVQDISDRKQLEKKVFDTIIETEENERTILAGDLHDEVGPLLSSLSMYLSLVSREDCPNRTDLLGTMNKVLKDTIIAVREISNNLSSHVLSNYGLISALNDFIASKQNLIQIELKSSIELGRFDSKIEVTCYRIIKELVNNTLKYAQANHILINLHHENNILKLYYKDNGLGFDMDEIMTQEHKGIGLLNIISRVKAINGYHRIVSQPGNGFLFELFIELNN